MKCRYIAGVWETGLLHQLLWRRLGTAATALTGPMEYQGPSWSWFGVDGEVFTPDYTPLERNYGNYHCANLARMLDAEVTVRGPDEFGPVSHGRIRVQGLVGILRELMAADGFSGAFNTTVEAAGKYLLHRSRLPLLQ